MSAPGGSCELLVVQDREALVAVAAETIVQACLVAGRERGRCLLALSGGSTPGPIFRRLASPEYERLVPWARVHLLWGDERCVPADHPQSNYRLAAESGLVSPALAGIHRMRGEIAPAEAAVAYEGLLRSLLSPAAATDATPSEPPRLDLALMGLGEDGHTASLFPESADLDEEERWVVATEPRSELRRLTLTLPVFRQARRLLFVIEGERKAEALRRTLSGEEPDLPAARLLQTRGRVTLLSDAAAASRLDRQALTAPAAPCRLAEKAPSTSDPRLG